MGVTDDPGWGRDAAFTSQYAALFRANPFLEYIDLSHTGLTNEGLFYLILDLSSCDPFSFLYGHKCLKQLVLGPPFNPNCRFRSREPFMKTTLAVVPDIYLQIPALELVCLIHPSALAVSECDTCCDTWLRLDGYNHASDYMYEGSFCSVLGTRCSTSTLILHCIQLIVNRVCRDGG
jgi:hypothetical protein